MTEIEELRARVEALEADQSPSPSVDRMLALQDQIRDGALTLTDALKEIGAALAQPEPVAPTDDDLRGIFSRFCDSGDNGPPWIECEEFILAARAAPARWGTPANNTIEEN
jgi:hypothetical protein